MTYNQCFLCREWSWDVSRSFDKVHLCLPCYVDCLEVRQARGVIGEPDDLCVTKSHGVGSEAEPGNSPSLSNFHLHQFDMFTGRWE